MYNYEFIDDFNEPQLGTLGKFLLKRVLHNTSKSHMGDFPLFMMNSQAEGSNILTSSTKSTINPMIFPSAKQWGPNVYDKDNHTMAVMVIEIFTVIC